MEEGTTWTYPSPQMFYNALSRKGKLADSTENEDNEDEQDMMESVVALHNDMNEKTWQKVMQWELATQPQNKESSKLLKFQGRPKDLSPKAWVKHNILGHPLPFDRHDWTVLRPNGTTVRYVMDYYYDESQEKEDEGSPSGENPLSSSSTLLVDVRPALDSVSSLWHRCAVMPFARHISHSTAFEPLPMRPTFSMKSQVNESVQVWQNIQADISASSRGTKDDSSSKISNEAQARDVAKLFENTREDCRVARQALDGCEEDCARASMDLTLCMAKSVCPLQHGALITALKEDDDNSIEASLERVSECVALQTRRHAEAKQKYPALFSATS